MRISDARRMADPLEKLADSLGCILARTLYREQLEQEVRQKQLDELDAIASRTQQQGPVEGTEDASGDLCEV